MCFWRCPAPPSPLAPPQVTIGTTGCTSIAVNVTANQLTCTLPIDGSSGTGIYVSIKVANANSNSSAMQPFFTYASPTITAVSRSVSGAGGSITITGTNFGATSAGLTQTAGGAITFGSLSAPVPTAVSFYTLSINFAASQYPPFTCVSPIMTTAHTNFSCTMPAGVGMDLDVCVTALGLTTCVAANATFGLSYLPPTIVSVTKGSPFGGTITIAGTNFGPTTASTGTPNVNVTISSATYRLGVAFKCLTPYVSKVNTQITCTVPPASAIATGDGAGLITADGATDGISAFDSAAFDVTVQVGYFDPNYLPASNIQNVTLSRTYQMERPNVTSITAVDDSKTGGKLNIFGGIVNITGRNFGPPCSSISGTAPGTGCNVTAGRSPVRIVVGSVVLTNSVTGTTSSFVTTHVFSPNVVAGPGVVTEHTLIYAYVPDYTSMGVSSLTPSFQVGILYFVNSSTPVYLLSNSATLTYEGPVFDTLKDPAGALSGTNATVGGSESGGDTGFFTITGRNFGVYSTYASTALLVAEYMGAAYFKSLFDSSCFGTVAAYPDASAVFPALSTMKNFTATGTSSYMNIKIGAYSAIGTGGMPGGSCTTPAVTTAGYQFIAVRSDSEIEFMSSAATFASPRNELLQTVAVYAMCGTCTSANSSNAAVFSYLGPVVISASSVATGGGSVIITGQRFGLGGSPSGSNAVTIGGIDCSSIYILTPITLNCSLAAAADSTQVFFGSNKALVSVKLAGLTGTRNNTFTHSLPTITSITGTGADSTVLSAGETITITGTGFGPDNGGGAAVNITSPSPNASNSAATTNQSCVVVSVTSHTQITCTIPAGAGARIPATVTIAYGGVRASVTAPLVTYQTPTLDSYGTPSATAGGLVSITGTGFGPRACTGCVALYVCYVLGCDPASAAAISPLGDVVSSTSISVTMPPWSVRLLRGRGLSHLFFGTWCSDAP